jgi:hypothetical protein
MYQHSYLMKRKSEVEQESKDNKDVQIKYHSKSKQCKHFGVTSFTWHILQCLHK